MDVVRSRHRLFEYIVCHEVRFVGYVHERLACAYPAARNDYTVTNCDIQQVRAGNDEFVGTDCQRQIWCCPACRGREGVYCTVGCVGDRHRSHDMDVVRSGYRLFEYIVGYKVRLVSHIYKRLARADSTARNDYTVTHGNVQQVCAGHDKFVIAHRQAECRSSPTCRSRERGYGSVCYIRHRHCSHHVDIISTGHRFFGHIVGNKVRFISYVHEWLTGTDPATGYDYTITDRDIQQVCTGYNYFIIAYRQAEHRGCPACRGWECGHCPVGCIRHRHCAHDMDVVRSRYRLFEYIVGYEVRFVGYIHERLARADAATSNNYTIAYRDIQQVRTGNDEFIGTNFQRQGRGRPTCRGRERCYDAISSIGYSHRSHNMDVVRSRYLFFGHIIRNKEWCIGYIHERLACANSAACDDHTIANHFVQQVRPGHNYFISTNGKRYRKSNPRCCCRD